jgi:hypothetical protein
MVITGRIFDIVIVSDKVAQIVLKKKMADKIVPVAIAVFGYWKDKIINEMKLKPKDKIKGNIYLKSRIYNGKYYTDIYFKEVYVVEEYVKPFSNVGNLFEEQEKAVIEEIDDLRVDVGTGEVFE